MDASQNVDVNLAKCLQHANDWGVTHYNNVCSGKVMDVPWGTADWFGVIAISSVGVLFILMMGAMAVSIIRD